MIPRIHMILLKYRTVLLLEKIIRILNFLMKANDFLELSASSCMCFRATCAWCTWASRADSISFNWSCKEARESALWCCYREEKEKDQQKLVVCNTFCSFILPCASWFEHVQSPMKSRTQSKMDSSHSCVGTLQCLENVFASNFLKCLHWLLIVDPINLWGDFSELLK